MIYHHKWEPFWDYEKYMHLSDKYFHMQRRRRWWFIRFRWLVVRPFVLHEYRYWKQPKPPAWKQHPPLSVLDEIKKLKGGKEGDQRWNR